MAHNIPSGYHPAVLGKQASQSTGKVDLIPWKGGDVTVTLACSEFTSLCPVTGQPDFGELTIRYAPRRYLVETKSLKLFLAAFRSSPVFNEDVCVRIADTLHAQIKPRWLEVCGRFHSRGGISLQAEVHRGAAAQPGRAGTRGGRA